MKKVLLLTTLSLIAILFTFSACQQKAALQQSPNDRFQHTVYFKEDNKAKTAGFFSEEIAIKTEMPTPFIMLSGYVKDPKFEGNLFYRTITEKEWSEWQTFPRMHEGKTPDRTVFAAIELDDKTTYLQIKSDTPSPAPFVIRLFTPGHSSHEDDTSIRSGSENCTCEQPDFCGRMCWCPSGNCPLDATPQATTPTHIIVHHSAGHTTSSDYAAVVRSYYDYHVNTNGWDDIGYNWLIDPHGVVYEGRGENRQGAHFSCMNSNTTGICMIGNYETAIPSTNSITALQNFIAWEACSKNINVLASDYHSNSETNLNNVSGHLDGNGLPNSCTTTACPGANLYPLLGDIRNQVAEMVCMGDLSSTTNELSEEEKILVFPNPVVSDFTMQWENIDVNNIILSNTKGQMLRQWQGSDFSNSSIRTEWQTGINAGVYLLQFSLDDGRVIAKRIVALQ